MTNSNFPSWRGVKKLDAASKTHYFPHFAKLFFTVLTTKWPLKMIFHDSQFSLWNQDAGSIIHFVQISLPCLPNCFSFYKTIKIGDLWMKSWPIIFLGHTWTDFQLGEDFQASGGFQSWNVTRWQVLNIWEKSDIIWHTVDPFRQYSRSHITKSW